MSNSPLLGYNNNIPYKGRVYHVQTEDSGTKRPHVITHLFADGGRIVNTTKTSYKDFVEDDNMAEKVRALMKEQHRAMVVSLRDGEFDEILDPSRPGASSPGLAAGGSDVPLARASHPSQPEIDGTAREGARKDGTGAYKKIVARSGQGGAAARKQPPPPRAASRSTPPGRAGAALFGHAVRSHRSVPPGPPTIEAHDEPFGRRFTSERMLDEVVSAFFEGV